MQGEVISTHNWKAGGQQNREAPFLEYMHAWPGRSIDCGTDGQRRRGAAELGNTQEEGRWGKGGEKNVRLLFCVLAAEVRSRDAGAAGLRGGDEAGFFGGLERGHCEVELELRLVSGFFG